MSFEAKILADSVPSFAPDARLTTMELTYPRFVHAEHLRHRVFSFNVASSRAIPVGKMIQQVWSDPVIPIYWGAAQKGMQADQQVGKFKAGLCRFLWLKLRLVAIAVAWSLVKLGLHKQIPNRILEPWMWCTVICTGNAKAWAWFFKLRCHPAAEPHIRNIAEMARYKMAWQSPRTIGYGDAHLPLIETKDRDAHLSQDDALKVSAGRCARVSYLTHDGIRDEKKDIELFESLIANNHWSPTEHQAICSAYCTESEAGNLGKPWVQFRKTFFGEFSP